MSFLSNHTLEKISLQEPLTADAWNQEIVPLLPKDLEESAWRLGAMMRKGGKIHSASDLLRSIMVYTLCVTSFQALGVWGVVSGIADMADTSWRDRVRKSCDWLCWLLNELIRPEKQKGCPSLKKAGYGPIELVDASHWKCVGKQGNVWRFHCMYSLLTQQLHQVVVSTTKVAESMARFCLEAGTIYVHDGGYGYRGQVAQTSDAGAYSVTAFCPRTFPVEDAQEQAIDLTAWLKKQRAKAGSIKSMTVFFRANGKKYEARVIGLRRTEEQAKRVLHQKKRKSVKKHRILQEETQYLTDWLLVLTTLPAKDWNAQEILSLYRARWQIEMLFKRIKQLLDQHVIRAETEEMAKATVAAILVGWVLQQGVAVEMRSLLEEVYSNRAVKQGEIEREEKEEETETFSEWMLQKVSVDLFLQQAKGLLTRQRLFECIEKLERHFGYSPRKRTHQWHRVTQWLVDPEIPTNSLGDVKSRNIDYALNTALA